jgi:hypothetical protein
VKGIQVCSNKGPGPLQRGDNHNNVKIGLGHPFCYFMPLSGIDIDSKNLCYPENTNFHGIYQYKSDNS